MAARFQALFSIVNCMWTHLWHDAGNFPLWLAPDPVRVITLNDDEALINYAQPIVAELRANMVRVDADYSATPFKAKFANAER
jgi:threonyl-tRNA synthetase